MATKLITKITCVGLISAGLVTMTGCTTLNPYTGEKQVSDTTIGTGAGAVGGAIIGGLIAGRDGALVGAAVGGLGGAAVGAYLDNENAELRQVLMGSGVQVVKTSNGIQLYMASDVTFRTDSADINQNFYQILKSVAIVLKKYNNNSIIISGYTDNTGSAEHNQVLSEQRAASVGSFLASQGINQKRIYTQGYGKRYPVASNATAEGRAKNRRVVITLR